MKAFPIDSTKHDYYGKTCLDEECRKPMRVGDVVLVEANPNPVAVVDREYFWHKRCIEKALRFAPAESSEVTAAVDEIKALIAATGHGPVSWALGDDDGQ